MMQILLISKEEKVLVFQLLLLKINNNAVEPKYFNFKNIYHLILLTPNATLKLFIPDSA